MGEKTGGGTITGCGVTIFIAIIAIFIGVRVLPVVWRLFLDISGFIIRHILLFIQFILG